MIFVDQISPSVIDYDFYRNQVLSSNAYGNIQGAQPHLTAKPFSLSWKDRLKEELSELFAQVSIPNWDGYDSLPASQDNFNYAAKFIEIMPEGIQEPHLTADPDGSFAFEWSSQERSRVLSVSIDKNTLVYASVVSPKNKQHGEEVFFDSIPENLIQILANYFRKAG